MSLHQQLHLPGRQEQQPSLPCTWETLNVGYRGVLNYRLKYCQLKVVCCRLYVNQTILNRKLSTQLAGTKCETVSQAVPP